MSLTLYLKKITPVWLVLKYKTFVFSIFYQDTFYLKFLTLRFRHNVERKIINQNEV